jgi:hypothetical protein
MTKPPRTSQTTANLKSNPAHSELSYEVQKKLLMQSYYDIPNPVDISKVMKSIIRGSIMGSNRDSTPRAGDAKLIIAPKDLNHLWDCGAGLDSRLEGNDGGYLAVGDGNFPSNNLIDGTGCKSHNGKKKWLNKSKLNSGILKPRTTTGRATGPVKPQPNIEFSKSHYQKSFLVTSPTQESVNPEPVSFLVSKIKNRIPKACFGIISLCLTDRPAHRLSITDRLASRLSVTATEALFTAKKKFSHCRTSGLTP